MTPTALLLLALAACGGDAEAPEAADGAEVADGAETTTEVASTSDAELPTTKDKVSYAIGYDIGSTFKRQELDLDHAILMKGIEAATTEGAEPLMTEEEMKETMRTFSEEQRAAQMEKRKREAEENKTEGEAFLAENGAREGVTTTESGLQYEVLSSGDGATPGASDRVTTHYRGTLIDGTEFDSSYSRGQPATFRVGGVIKGWTEALQLMKTGDKWKLYIPGDLAYGERGSPPKIGPNATLIFEIELISIESS